MSNQRGRNNKSLLLLRISLYFIVVGFIGFLFAPEGGILTPKRFSDEALSEKFAKKPPVPKMVIPWNPDLKIYDSADIEYDRRRKIKVHTTSQQPFTGRYRKYNGNKEIEYKDGKYHGIYKQNYDDGYLRSLIWYTEAVEQRRQVFHRNGNLWQDVNYKDVEMQIRGKKRKVKLADFKTFYQNGNPHSSGSKIGSYARHGLIKRYHKDGTLFSETVWDRGSLVETVKIKAKDASFPPIITNSIGMEFMLIPSGSFIMGNDNGHELERPAHTVNIKNYFYLSKYELTVGQVDKILNIGLRQEADNLPALDISAWDVTRYLNTIEACEECYRLPTEAEWEYAARAGTTSKYYWGNEMNGDYAWYSENSDQMRQPVGLKKPNNWGLYDMIGNVWEPTLRRPRNPKMLKEQLESGYSRSGNPEYLSKILLDDNLDKQWTARVRRGGSFGTPADHSTVSRRYKSIYIAAGRRTGLRLLLTTDY